MSEILLESIIILGLIILNGLLAMSELAVVSSRHVRLQQMAQDGNHGAEVALELAETPNRFLSTVQVGITLVGIFAGAIGGATIAQALTALLAEIPALEPYASAISLVLVVGGITFFTVVLGELVPKRIALQSAERIAAAVARPMRALSVVTWPIVRLLGLATDAVLAVLRVKAQPKTTLTEEEIRMLVEQGAQAGIIEAVERDMVESIFQLGDRSLETIMTPRSEIEWLDVNATEEHIRQIVASSSHSRFPVCDGELDKPLGLVRTQDLLAESMRGEPLNLRQAMDEPLFAPENARALQVLERFRETGVHLAMLIDEYGGVSGLVTSFNVLEAIVGDIPTPDEIDQPPIAQRADGSWLVDGLLSVDDFKRSFNIASLPGEDTYKTLGGFVIFMFGSLPAAGDYFSHGDFRYEVADMDGRRVDKVLLARRPANAESEISQDKA
ncbi:MAG: HlyC/CorC family transporter [Chloroflexota bacterium]|nr:MAG: HlyC/CorC family transporter [Chloroflexota bacterium]